MVGESSKTQSQQLSPKVLRGSTLIATKLWQSSGSSTDMTSKFTQSPIQTAEVSIETSSPEYSMRSGMFIGDLQNISLIYW